MEVNLSILRNDRFRGPAYDYVKRREAKRNRAQAESHAKRLQEEFRTSFERDVRAEIERHDRALKGQEQRENVPF